MTDKVFMIFNSLFDKREQAIWFVNTFIKEEHRDPGYLLSISPRRVQYEYGISCNRYDDGWVWLEKSIKGKYTRGMTQVFYEQKDLGEL